MLHPTVFLPHTHVHENTHAPTPTASLSLDDGLDWVEVRGHLQGICIATSSKWGSGRARLLLWSTHPCTGTWQLTATLIVRVHFQNVTFSPSTLRRGLCWLAVAFSGKRCHVNTAFELHTFILCHKCKTPLSFRWWGRQLINQIVTRNRTVSSPDICSDTRTENVTSSHPFSRGKQNRKTMDSLSVRQLFKRKLWSRWNLWKEKLHSTC